MGRVIVAVFALVGVIVGVIVAPALAHATPQPRFPDVPDVVSLPGDGDSPACLDDTAREARAAIRQPRGESNARGRTLDRCDPMVRASLEPIAAPRPVRRERWRVPPAPALDASPSIDDGQRELHAPRGPPSRS